MSKSKNAVRWLVGSTVVVFGAIAIVSWRLGLLSASSQLDEELKLARQQGLPLTAADLRLPLVPDDQNAATLIRNAVDLMRALPGRPETDLSNWGSTYWTPPVSDASAEKAIADLKPILDIAEKASLRPHFDPHWDWNAGFRLGMPEIYDIKRLAKCLASRARFQIHQGQTSVAAESLIAAARLGHLLSEQPEVLCLLTRVSIEAFVGAACADLLRLDAGYTSITNVKRILDSFGPLPDIKFSLRGTFLLSRSSLPQMGYFGDREPSGPTDDTAYPEEWKLMRVKPIEQRNEAIFVKFYRMRYTAAPASPAVLQQAEAAIDEIKKSEDALPRLDSIGLSGAYSLSKQILEVWGECATRRRVLAAGLKILNLKAKRGSFPGFLPMTGEDFSDPFTGKPLTYHRIGNGFVLYSFDMDRKDDGGRPYSENSRKDLSFEYPKLSVRPEQVVAPGPPGGAG